MDTFMNVYGFSTEDAMLAVKYFREYYNEQGWSENEIYENKLLKKLSA